MDAELRKEKAAADEKLQTARASEAKVGDWRRWRATEWVGRGEKEAELKAAQVAVQEKEA